MKKMAPIATKAAIQMALPLLLSLLLLLPPVTVPLLARWPALPASRATSARAVLPSKKSCE
jgi:hypothetical protein